MYFDCKALLATIYTPLPQRVSAQIADKIEFLQFTETELTLGSVEDITVSVIK